MKQFLTGFSLCRPEAGFILLVQCSSREKLSNSKFRHYYFEQLSRDCQATFRKLPESVISAKTQHRISANPFPLFRDHRKEWTKWIFLFLFCSSPKINSIILNWQQKEHFFHVKWSFSSYKKVCKKQLVAVSVNYFQKNTVIRSIAQQYTARDTIIGRRTEKHISSFFCYTSVNISLKVVEDTLDVFLHSQTKLGG